jgi:hypothetical protein
VDILMDRSVVTNYCIPIMAPRSDVSGHRAGSGHRDGGMVEVASGFSRCGLIRTLLLDFV